MFPDPIPRAATRSLSTNGHRAATPLDTMTAEDVSSEPMHAAIAQSPAAPAEVVTRFKRRELKFVLDAAQRERLTADLLAFMLPDPHGDGDGHYPVVDLYYDNRFHDLYWEHARGIRSRQKLRLRVYGAASGTELPYSFLELKRKHKGRVYKQRVALPIDEALAVAAGADPRSVTGRAGLRVIEQVQTLTQVRQLHPSCVLRYDRQALRGTGDEAELRITFDTDIRFRLDDLVPVPDDLRCDRELMATDRAVMEVKVPDQVPHWLAGLIHRHGCVRQGHSKYCRSFESVFMANGTGAEARRRWTANLA